MVESNKSYTFDPDADPARLDALTAFTNQIAQYELLEPADEIILGRHIQRARSIDPSNSDISPDKRERILARGERARHRLVEANMRLVVSIARRFHSPTQTLLDLIQEGAIGLNRAAERFDPERGFKFSTYATWWVRQSVGRAVMDKGTIISLPIHLHSRLRYLANFAESILANTGYPATDAQLAQALKDKYGKGSTIVNETIDAFRKHIANPVSLEAPLGDQDDDSLGDRAEAPDNTSDRAELNLLRDEVERVLDDMEDGREAQVLRLRFGVGGDHGMTLQEVGTEWGVTRERVRQVERKAKHSFIQSEAGQKLYEYVKSTSRRKNKPVPTSLSSNQPKLRPNQEYLKYNHNGPVEVRKVDPDKSST